MGATRDRRTGGACQRRDGDGRARHRIHHRIARHRGHSTGILEWLPQSDGILMETGEIRQRIDELHTRYIRLIDDERWEEWPELFTDSCCYKIVTRENFDQAMPLSVMECHSRGMLTDRVTGLRTINVYEPHRYLHQISGLEIDSVDSDVAGDIVSCR